MTAQAPSKPTAVQKLAPSVFKPTQLELMGDDVDISKFYLALAGGTKDYNVVAAVTDIQVQRTIEGASTVTVDLTDHDRKLLRSGLLAHRLTIEIDGLFFTLVSVEKNGGDLTLTFEDREIYVLRTYNKPIKQSQATSRTKVTRAEFILRLLKEVKEMKIKYVIPELSVVQPIGKTADSADQSTATTNRQFGIPKANVLFVKSARMTEEQRVNANIILDVGAGRLLPRKDLMCAIMCVIQESTIHNLMMGKPGDYNYLGSDPAGNPVGCFQQIKKYGWPATRDVATDAGGFYDHLAPIVAANPSIKHEVAIEAVQRSGEPGLWAQWLNQAEAIVTAYGVTDSTVADANNQRPTIPASTGDYEFYRGIPPTSVVQKRKGVGGWGKESSWDCINRLAQEVSWRAFFVSGVFYFIDDEDLFRSKPQATLDEDSDGVISINGTYDEGKKSATVTISCMMSRWAAPPGSVIQLKNMGPWNGRWLVSNVNRSIFNRAGTITLKKPLPILPEPAGTNLSTQGQTYTGAPTPSTDQPAGPSSAIATGSAQKLALDLILQAGKGWTDDNGRGLDQLKKVAAGQPLSSQSGAQVQLDPNTLRVVLYLIDKGYSIGTYAWCEDHHDDGPNGHAGGKAVDISSINGQAINKKTDKVRQLVIEVDTIIHGLTGSMHPRQLITGGYGYTRDFAISGYSIPSADSYYGATTMQEHTNHIHVGF